MWHNFSRETDVQLISASNVDASSGSMSKRPHRSVSASDQTWICLVGVNPDVLRELSVSDMNNSPMKGHHVTIRHETELYLQNEAHIERSTYGKMCETICNGTARSS
jgi:hypothetical protein